MSDVLTSLQNFRDVGGLATTDGRTTRHGVLYRSDSPHNASVEDVARLAGELGVTAVVDLRSEREVREEGHQRGFPDSVHRHHFPIAGGAGNAVEAAASGERLAARYLEYLDEHADSIVAAVRTVAAEPGASVVHCRVGKDRTGVVIGLILSSVGVRDDEVARDFERTTPAMTRIMAQLRASPTYAANVNRLPEEMYRSDAPTMTAFLAKLRDRDGGAARWLIEHGLDPAVLDLLAARLLGTTTEGETP
jgi:protein tyrosine/serine phosphatase